MEHEASLPEAPIEKAYEFSGYLIQIADYQALLRAVMVLGEVPIPHVGLTDNRFGVTKAHVEKLRAEGIPFDILS